MNHVSNLLATDMQERLRLVRLSSLRPSPTSVPDASGCWCDMGAGPLGQRWIQPESPWLEAEWSWGRRDGEAMRWAGIRNGTVFCVCETGRAALAEWQRRDHEIRRDWTMGQRKKAWEDSGIPTRYREMTYKTHPLAKTMPELFGRIEWSNLDDSGGEEFYESWLFFGGYGTGKTGLAVAMANWSIYGDRDDDTWEPRTVVFRTLPDLCTELRSTYGRNEGPTEAAVLARYKECDLLILDDLGAEQLSGTGWLEDRLYQIIGGRHGEEKQTVFTSNLTPAELGARIGERNMWRVIEMCTEKRIVNIKGPNLRQKKE